MGYNYGLPLSHLLLARQLEGLTTLRKRSVLYDDRLKKTRMAIDWFMAVALPIIGILLHLTQQVSPTSTTLAATRTLPILTIISAPGTTILYHGRRRMHPSYLLERLGCPCHGICPNCYRCRCHDLHRYVRLQHGTSFYTDLLPCFVFLIVMALVNIYLRRQRMLSMISADSQMARNQFLRLYMVSLAEIGTCV